MTTKEITKSEPAAPAIQFGAVETAIAMGDLSKLDANGRTEYLNRLCDSLGLNVLTQPFAYLQLNGKLVLYCRKEATDQLRALHRISVRIIERNITNDLLVVTAEATAPDGRTDESTGAVNVKGLQGEALANAMMKAETKAKRRVTLSICGLGFPDESELDDLGSERTVREPIRRTMSISEREQLAISAPEERDDVDPETGELASEPDEDAWTNGELDAICKDLGIVISEFALVLNEPVTKENYRERINAWLGQNPDKALIHLAEEVEVAKRKQVQQPALA